MKQKRLVRVFKTGLRGGWVEIYQVVPRPKYDGEFFLAFRKKCKRKIFALMSGITAAGVKVIKDQFRERRVNLTKLNALVVNQLDSKSVRPISPATR